MVPLPVKETLPLLALKRHLETGGTTTATPTLVQGHQSLLMRCWVSQWLTCGIGVVSGSPPFQRTLNYHRWTKNGWLLEKMPRQMRLGFFLSKRSETCKFKERRFWPYLSFFTSNALGLLIGRLG